MARFALKILNPKHVLFAAQVESVFLPGDQGEFELQSQHAPLISLLKEGAIVVDWTTAIPVKKGMVRFSDEECVILVEEPVHRERVPVLSSIEARRRKQQARRPEQPVKAE